MTSAASRVRERAARVPGAGRDALALALLALALGLPGAVAAKNGAYRDAAHGRRDTGVVRLVGTARGECIHCHGAPRDAAGQRPDGRWHTALFSAANDLCLGCHERAAGSWLGAREYGDSGHGTSPSVIWPGPMPPARSASDAGLCVNCHDPHGVKDAAGLVPSLLHLRPAALCLGCHAGSPGADVASAFSRPYRHPLVADPAKTGAPADAAPGSALAGGRSVAGGTCSGCHNPHAAAADPAARVAGEVARALAGAARVRLANGTAGSAPTRVVAARSDRMLVREYEVCFKCHSGTGRLTRSDLAAALNPANPSFHPVEGRGRNVAIDRRSFAVGWSADRLVTCSDCHASDDESTRGPHGSTFPHILRRRHLADAGSSAPAQETDLCFECHGFATYADPFPGPATAFSRYAGHATHASKGVSCWACHDAHGSATLPALLTLRAPGLARLEPEAGGGTCTVTCHLATGSRVTYRVAYPR